MFYVKIPHERVPVLIGKNGETKKRIEDITGVTLDIDSASGQVQIMTEDENNMTTMRDPILGLKARDVVTAIGRGFAPQKAMKLLSDDMYFEVLEIKEYAGKNQNKIQRLRGRVIGTRGRTRELIEELTSANISIYGNTVSIICDFYSMSVAKRAIEMLLEGAKQASVYSYLEKKQQDIKSSR